MTVLSELSKLSKRSKCCECQLKLVATEIEKEHDDYLQQLFRGGTSSIALHGFISQTFRIIDFFRPTIKTITKIVYVRSVSERTFLNSGYITNFTIKNEAKNLPPGLGNRCFNSEQKDSNDSVRKEQLLDCKKRQRRSYYFCSKLSLANISYMV